MSHIATLLSHSTSKEVTNMVVKAVKEDKSKMTELIQLILENEEPISTRAAWAMSYAAMKWNDVFFDNLIDLLELAKKKDSNKAYARNIFRVTKTIITNQTKLHGYIIDAAFYFLNDLSNPVAVRAFALQTLVKYIKFYPDIISEINVAMELNNFNAKPGLKNCILKSKIQIQRFEHLFL